MKHVPVTNNCRRFGEVLVLAALVCIVTFIVSYLYGSCAPLPPADPSQPYIDDLVSFYCDNSQYNEMASMFMVPSENAIKQLFHSKQSFGLGHLAVFYATYTILSCLVYGELRENMAVSAAGSSSSVFARRFARGGGGGGSGVCICVCICVCACVRLGRGGGVSVTSIIKDPYFAIVSWQHPGIAVPSGLFIPSLLSGAALGRLVGEVLHNVIGFNVEPGARDAASCYLLSEVLRQ
jgi:hypothetical protein